MIPCVIMAAQDLFSLFGLCFFQLSVALFVPLIIKSSIGSSEEYIQDELISDLIT